MLLHSWLQVSLLHFFTSSLPRPFVPALPILNLLPFQMPSLLLLLLHLHSFTTFPPLLSPPGLFHLSLTPLFSFHPSLCDFFPVLPSLYTILHPSLSPSSTLHSQGILWLISLFSFSPFHSLSLFNPSRCVLFYLSP